MISLLAVLLAASVDGEAALRHASALAALGPHPWGSSRNQAAAEYIASALRDAGLTEVRLQGFESQGIRGTNVIGVLRAPGPELVVVGAHHDTAPDAPGAYDDGGGVGVLIEAARMWAREPSRTRTFVFASFDGEEAWSTGKGTTTGSRAYIKELGPDARSVVAAFVIEMCGWKGGAPVFHPIPYADPRQPGASVVTPAWLLRAGQEGAAAAGAPIGLGDPLIPWLYQPVVRTFRVSLYGDDLSFLQAGLPALFVSDSSFTAYYPWYHQAGDTADKLDAPSLARMGAGVLGVMRALDRAPRGPAAEPHWFLAFGRVLGLPVLLAIGLASLLPGLLTALAAGGPLLLARLLHAVLFGLLLWRHPVPALSVLLLPNLLLPVLPRAWTAALSLLPVLALVGVGAVAWSRGYARGLWLEPWEIAVLVLALALALVRSGRGKAQRKSRGRNPGRR
jgi:peptidase M28-like protein